MTKQIVLTGDSIINRRVSTCDEEGFRDLVEVFRDGDVTFTHLETLIHDYRGDKLYPAAEAGGTWMRSPAYTADELEWCGFDLVSHASNHALDYGYGALETTWAAMEGVGIPIAGTGRNLGEAREPAYLESDVGRVGLVSMTTSFPRWSRAGHIRYDLKGRPGINPLGFHYAVDSETLDMILETATRLGIWIERPEEDVITLNPPGLHNTLARFEETEADSPELVIDHLDADENLQSIREAANQAEIVIAHIHTHAWDPDGGLKGPPAFLQTFARECIDAGAHIVIAQGSHTPLRPIELYDGKPIFYDPGDLFMMSDSVTKLPADFHARFVHRLDTDPRISSHSEAKSARGGGYEQAINPEGGYFDTPYRGHLVVPVCDFNDDMTLHKVTLYPAASSYDRSSGGIPIRKYEEEARTILERVKEISAPFGTELDIENDRATIRPN